MVSKKEKLLYLSLFLFLCFCILFMYFHLHNDILKVIESKIDLDSLDVVTKYLGIEHCVIKDDSAFITYAGKEFDVFALYLKVKGDK